MCEGGKREERSDEFEGATKGGREREREETINTRTGTGLERRGKKRRGEGKRTMASGVST
jgi:hypothetical protein